MRKSINIWTNDRKILKQKQNEKMIDNQITYIMTETPRYIYMLEKLMNRKVNKFKTIKNLKLFNYYRKYLTDHSSYFYAVCYKDFQILKLLKKQSHTGL